MQPCLPKELIKIYSTPKGWPEPKSKGTCLGWSMRDVYYNSRGSIFIPEAWLWVQIKQDRSQTWTSIFPFYEVWRLFLLYALPSLPMGPIPLEWWRHLIHLMATWLADPCWISRLSLDKFRPQGPFVSNQISVSIVIALSIPYNPPCSGMT